MFSAIYCKDGKVQSQAKKHRSSRERRVETVIKMEGRRYKQ